MSKELSTFDEVHDEKDSELVLKNVVHRYNEWMVDVIKNLLLKLEGIVLFVLNNYILTDTLHSVDLVGLGVQHLVYLTEGTLSNDSHDLEIFQVGITLLFVLEHQL